MIRGEKLSAEDMSKLLLAARSTISTGSTRRCFAPCFYPVPTSGRCSVRSSPMIAASSGCSAPAWPRWRDIDPRPIRDTSYSSGPPSDSLPLRACSAPHDIVDHRAGREAPRSGGARPPDRVCARSAHDHARPCTAIGVGPPAPWHTAWNVSWHRPAI
jgi:hypothetical protein